MRKQTVHAMVRITAMTAVTAVALLSSASAALAQSPYIVRFIGPYGKTSGLECAHYETAPPASPTSTSCYGIVVWYKGTFAGFNNYAVGGQAIWTNSFACPSTDAGHQSRVWAMGSLLNWVAQIYTDYGDVTFLNGNVNVNGGLSRNFTLQPIDASKCNP